MLLAERMDDPLRHQWFEFARGLTSEQSQLVIRYLGQTGRRARAQAVAEIVEALRTYDPRDEVSPAEFIEREFGDKG